MLSSIMEIMKRSSRVKSKCLTTIEEHSFYTSTQGFRFDRTRFAYVYQEN